MILLHYQSRVLDTVSSSSSQVQSITAEGYAGICGIAQGCWGQLKHQGCDVDRFVEVLLKHRGGNEGVNMKIKLKTSRMQQ